MKYIFIWIACFLLLFAFFLTAHSKAEEVCRAHELIEHCSDATTDYPEAMKHDAMAACFYQMRGVEP